MNLITNNPYRILGVFVNTPLKERNSNINRFKAFIKVGKSVETNADFSIALGQSPNRTILTIEEANNDLFLPIERLKRAFFWFACTNQAEAIAFRHLSSGDIKKATSIFEKFSNWSSLLNFHTLSLLQGELKIAVQTFAKIIEFQKETLFDALNLETLKINNNEIYKLYYEELSKAYNPLEILKAAREILIEGHSLQQIVLKSICDRYINQINNLIDNAAAAVKSDAVSNLHAGQNLIMQASPILNNLREICKENVSEYTLIADKVALQVLKNGIQYYNHTSDPEAARIVMPLFAFSKDTAVGHIAKSRCEENYKTIKEAYDELPPIEIVEDIKAIETILNKFPDDTHSALSSKELVLNCAPYLGNIKEKCGLTHIAAIRISTQIVRKALNSIITEINNALDSLNRATYLSQSTERTKVKKVLSDAWDAILHLDRLPISEDSKNWYLKNCEGIKDMMQKVGISVLRFGSFTIKTETEYFEHCKTKDDYKAYLNYYPKGRFRKIASEKILEIEKEEELEKKRRQNLISKIKSATKLSELGSLKSLLTNNDKDILSLLDDKAWSLCKKRSDYKEYLYNYSTGRHTKEAETKSKSLKEKFINWQQKHVFSFYLCFLTAVATFILCIVYGLYGLAISFIIISISAIILVVGSKGLGKDTRAFCLTISIFAIICAIILFLAYDTEKNKLVAEKELAKLNLNSSWEEYNKFFANYSHFFKYEELSSKLQRYYEITLDSCYSTLPDYSEGNNSLENVSGLGYLTYFMKTCNNSKYTEFAERKFSEIIDSLYYNASELNSYQGWENYQNAVPSNEYRESDHRKEQVDTRWNTEASAWKTAQELNTTAAYSRYIELYPKGKHYAQADKILIDSEVADVFSTDYGILPAMDKTSGSHGSTSTISVYNNTSYTLMLLYSGTESKRLTLSPNERKTIKLKNGSYRVVASTSITDVNNYAGIENLEGGSYKAEYYLVTSAFSKYHKY